MCNKLAATTGVLYWVYWCSATLYIKISMRFTSIFPGYRTYSFQCQLNSLGTIQSCCHHGAGKYLDTQDITVQPGNHSKVKVKVEVYSLVSSANRYSPRLHTMTPWSQDLFIHKPSQFPGEHTARLPFSAHGTIQTHKPSLSYQVPTYSWVERVHVWAKCLA